MNPLVGIGSVLGRVLLATIFLLSAVGHKIPDFHSVAAEMEAAGVPAAKIMLVGAIVFLIAGSLSVIAGYKTTIGAGLLLVFLLLATYFFHNFWVLEGKAQEAQMIQFMKNLALMGAMIFLMANGPGAWSLDGRLAHAKTSASPSL